MTGPEGSASPYKVKQARGRFDGSPPVVLAQWSSTTGRSRRLLGAHTPLVSLSTQKLFRSAHYLEQSLPGATLGTARRY